MHVPKIDYAGRTTRRVAMSRSWKLGSLIIVAGLAGSALGQEAIPTSGRFLPPGGKIHPHGSRKDWCPPQGALLPPVPPVTSTPTTTPVDAPLPEPETGRQTSFYGGSIAAAGT